MNKPEPAPSQQGCCCCCWPPLSKPECAKGSRAGPPARGINTFNEVFLWVVARDRVLGLPLTFPGPARFQ